MAAELAPLLGAGATGGGGHGAVLGHPVVPGETPAGGVPRFRHGTPRGHGRSHIEWLLPLLLLASPALLARLPLLLPLLHRAPRVRPLHVRRRAPGAQVLTRRPPPARPVRQLPRPALHRPRRHLRQGRLRAVTKDPKRKGNKCHNRTRKKGSLSQ